MGTTLSFSGALYRSNVFDRYTIKKIGGTSRDSYKEFASTIDLSKNPTPTFPIAIPIMDISTIKFVHISVIGGVAQIRFVKNGAYTNSPALVKVTNERVAGIVDGSNNVFTLAETPVSQTENIYVNGTRQTPGALEAYVVSGNTIVFTAGSIPSANAVILADYYYTTGNEDVPVNTQNLDLNVGGTIIMSEVDINQLYIMSCPQSAIVEIIGMGL